MYAVELFICYGDRIVIKAFGVEKVSEVRNVVDLDKVKHKFSQEIQEQWGKIAKRPQGDVHLLVGQEMAAFHPIAYASHNDLLICRSMFGSGWLITETDESIEPEHKCWGEVVVAMMLGRVTSHNAAHTMATPVFTYTQDRDYYTLEGLQKQKLSRLQGLQLEGKRTRAAGGL